MRINVWTKAVAIAAVGLAATSGPVRADAAKPNAEAGEWPRWLGPDGTGISREPIADQWPAAGPKKLWSATIGSGYSSVVARDGKVYAFANDNGKDVLTCFDATSGAKGWSVADPQRFENDYAGTRASPTIDGDRIYTYGGGGQLVARELATGRQVWQVDVIKAAGSNEPLTWGQASSPFVHGGHVIVQAGKDGAVAVAVDKAAGKVAWLSAAKGVGGYAQVIAADVGGKTQLVAFGGTAAYGMDPATGKTLWQQPWKTSYDVNAATPVYDGQGNLFVASGYGVGGGMFKLTPGGAQKAWGPRKDLQCKFQPPILDGKTLFAVSEDKRGVVRAVEWPTGKALWELKEPKPGFGGSFVRVGDKLIVQSQTGEISMVKATAAAGTLVSTFKAFDGFDQVWTMPVVYQGKLYAKGRDELACYDLK